MAKRKTPDSFSFKEGDKLSAESLEALRRALAGDKSTALGFSDSEEYHTTFNEQTQEPIQIKTAVEIPAWSIFYIDATDLGADDPPLVQVAVFGTGYSGSTWVAMTNGGVAIPAGSKGWAHLIGLEQPVKLRSATGTAATGATPIECQVGKRCGPQPETFLMTQDAFGGFYCISPEAGDGTQWFIKTQALAIAGKVTTKITGRSGNTLGVGWVESRVRTPQSSITDVMTNPGKLEVFNIDEDEIGVGEWVIAAEVAGIGLVVENSFGSSDVYYYYNETIYYYEAPDACDFSGTLPRVTSFKTDHTGWFFEVTSLVETWKDGQLCSVSPPVTESWYRCCGYYYLDGGTDGIHIGVGDDEADADAAIGDSPGIAESCYLSGTDVIVYFPSSSKQFFLYGSAANGPSNVLIATITAGDTEHSFTVSDYFNTPSGQLNLWTEDAEGKRTTATQPQPVGTCSSGEYDCPCGYGDKALIRIYDDSAVGMTLYGMMAHAPTCTMAASTVASVHVSSAEWEPVTGMKANISYDLKTGVLAFYYPNTKEYEYYTFDCALGQVQGQVITVSKARIQKEIDAYQPGVYTVLTPSLEYRIKWPDCLCRT